MKSLIDMKSLQELFKEVYSEDLERLFLYSAIKEALKDSILLEVFLDEMRKRGDY